MFNINDEVQKKSSKPFKSGKKINTIKSLTVNPFTGLNAVTFIEDDSIVDIKMLEKV